MPDTPLYEHKYRQHLTHNQSRFAEPEEIIGKLSPLGEGGPPVAGVPLFCKDNVVYVDNSDTHSVVIGPTGCKKTRTTVFATVASCIEAGETVAINDPKGEIYNRTAALARKKGVKVHVLNFRDPDSSMGWNPLAQASKLYAKGKLTEATQVVNDFVEAVCAPNESRTSDRYWIDCARAILNSLILMLVASVPQNYCTITNLLPLCYECNSHALSELLAEMDQTSAAAFGLHSVLDLDAEKTKSCIYSVLLSVLTPFTQNHGLQKMLCDNSLDLSAIGDEQTIIYIIYPDEKNTLSFLVNAFFTQCYEALVIRASENEGNCLPVRVNFIMEEFANLPPINCFENRISEARSRNIRYFIYLQSYDQLRQKYGDTAETILSNCGNWVCFSSKESNFLSKLSLICGKEIDYNGIEHDLISAFSMQYLVKETSYAEALILRQGLYPYVAKLPDIDYIHRYCDIPREPLPRVTSDSPMYTLTFHEWYSGIDSGKFSFPFPKDDRPAPNDDDYDLHAEILAKFDELFGS